jgi:hypothetical protein
MEQYESERRESRLVQTFCQYLRSKGYEVRRLQVSPEGEVKPIFSDLDVPEIPLLVEAKGTVERGSIRMALGNCSITGDLLSKRGAPSFCPPGRDLILSSWLEPLVWSYTGQKTPGLTRRSSASKTGLGASVPRVKKLCWLPYHT